MYDTPLTFLRDSNSPGSVLLAVALGKYGTECFEWAPEILRLELEEDFGVKLTDLQSDKLQAAITVYTTDHFESNWHVFHTICHLLNNEYADSAVLDSPLEAEYIVGALPEIEFLRNDDEDGLTWSDEVNAYAGLIFAEYGCSKPPTLFPTALMPRDMEGDMTEKNAALDELYKAKKEYLEKYLAKVKAAYTV